MIRCRRVLALALACCCCLQLKLLLEFAASSGHPPRGSLIGLHAHTALWGGPAGGGSEIGIAAISNATSASAPASTEVSGVVGRATPPPMRRIYCPRCPWNDSMPGKKALCQARRSYLLGKERNNETKVDEYMKGAHPSCYIEHIVLEKRQSPAEGHGGGNHVIQKRGTSGRWVLDREYAERSAFIDHPNFYTWGLAGTADYKAETALRRNATSWRWVDDDSPVTEITLDGFCKVCYRLGVTRIFIIGDSLSQDFRRSLEAHLGFTHPGKYTIKTLFDMMVYEKFQVPCDQSVEGFDGVFLAFQKINGLDERKTGALRVAESGTPEFVGGNPNKTAVVLNIGAHMKNLEEYRRAFDAVLGWVDSWSRGENGVDAGKLHVFFRGTVPGHPGCHPRGSEGSNTNMINKRIAKEFGPERAREIYKAKLEMLNADESVPFANYDEYLSVTRREMEAQLRSGENGTWQWYDFQHANGTFEAYNAYTRRVFEARDGRAGTVQFHWLGVYNATVLRRDGHEAFGDCLHYLQPGPYSLWVHMFYSALLDLSRMDHRVL